MPSDAELGGSRQHLRQDRTRGDQVDLRRVRVERAGGVDQPVRAGQHLPPQHRVAEPLAGRLERRLVDRPGGEPEVVGAVLLGLGRRGRRRWRDGPPGRDPAERVAEQPVERHAVRRLDQRHLGQLEPDRRGDGRLVRAALRRQRDAGRRAGHDEPRPGVDGVDEGVQPAQHERVVDRADRQQRLAGQVAGEPELAEQQEQVHLADAELDVLPGRALGPLQQRCRCPTTVARRARTRPCG